MKKYGSEYSFRVNKHELSLKKIPLIVKRKYILFYLNVSLGYKNITLNCSNTYFYILLACPIFVY